MTHTDPARVAPAYEIYRRWPQPDEAAHGPRHVLRTGRPEMMSEIPDAVLAGAARDEEHLRALRALGLRSFISVPISSDQRIHDVLIFVTAEAEPAIAGIPVVAVSAIGKLVDVDVSLRKPLDYDELLAAVERYVK